MSIRLLSIIPITIIGIISSFTTFSQEVQLSNWSIQSSILDIVSGDFDKDGNFWAATSGGVFYYKLSSKEFKSFNNYTGLYSLDAKTIRSNPYTAEIYVGTRDGAISIADSKLNWKNLLDIKQSGLPKVEIYDINFMDTVAFISGAFGITTFDTRHHIFLKTPPRIGEFPSGTVVRNTIIYNGYLWVATESGIARIKLDTNISNPELWENFTEKDGLNNSNILFLAVENDTLFAFAETTIYKFNSSKFEKILQLENYDKINAVKTFKGSILYSTPFAIRDLKQNVIFYIDDSPRKTTFNGFVVSNDGLLAIFLKNNGVLFYNPNDLSKLHFKPNSPISNQFLSITVDEGGALWSATDAEPAGNGIMRFSKGIWTNLMSSDYPQMASNSYIKVTTVGNKTYASSWASGLLEITTVGDTLSFKLFNNKNSPLTGALSNNTDYIIVQQTAYEATKSLLWIINYAEGPTGALLLAKDNNDNFYTFIPTSRRRFHYIAIDDFGTKWIASDFYDAGSLIYFNENNTISDTSDDKFGELGSDLISLPIKSITTDQFGYIWCGTSQGIYVILNPSAVLSNKNPVVRKLKVLADQVINCIYTDALNFKWIATNSGVFVLSPDGSEIMKSFTTENSPLATNKIYSITSNSVTGDFYFGSPIGLILAKSLIISPRNNFDITVQPQPFFIPDDETLLIDGLAPETEIKILTIDGEAIRTINTSSRIVVWDGKDDSNNYVATGIYLLLAKSNITKETAVQKIAVIRK
jgi:ligand-binding sensor domain-containing protein